MRNMLARQRVAVTDVSSFCQGLNIINLISVSAISITPSGPVVVFFLKRCL